MFKFLKSLFGAKQPVEQPVLRATVPLQELVDWLRQARAPKYASFVEQLAETKTKINQNADTVREQVTALQSAKLMNPDIPERAKDFMEGNREEYTRRVLQYLDKLALPGTAEELPSFFAQHDNDAKEFTHGLMRPFQILQEFFSHESKAITMSLGEIEQKLMDLRSLHGQSNFDKNEGLCTEGKILIAKYHQLQELEKERSELYSQIAESDKSTQAFNTEEERLLKDANRLAELGKLSEEQKKVYAHEQKIRDIFANFEPALRKFHRMATRNVQLVAKYLQNPVSTLVEDLHLDILEVISDIERLIQFERIQLGNKKEYVADAMNFLNKKDLGNWLRAYGQLVKKEKDAQKKVENCEASITLAKIQRLRDEARRNKQLTEQKIALFKKDIEKINVESIKKQLEGKIKEITDTQVTIII